MTGRRRVLAGVLFAFGLLLASCQWPHYRGNAALTGVQTGETQIGVGNVGTLVEEWRGGPGVTPTGFTLQSPTVVDGRVHMTAMTYGVAPNGACSGVPLTCPPVENLFMGGDVFSAPTVDDGTTFVLPRPTGSGVSFSAFDADGASGCSGSPVVCMPVWTGTSDPYPRVGGFPPLVQGLGAPTVAGGQVYVTGTNRFYSFDAGGSTNCSGAPKVCAPLWASQDGAFATSLAIDGGQAYVVQHNQGPAQNVAGLAVYDAAGVTNCSGAPKVCQPLWRGDFGPDATARAGWTSPVVDGVVYATVSSRLLAFDANGVTGCAGSPKVCQPLWTAALPNDVTDLNSGILGAAVYGGKVYVPTGTAFAAFDASGTVGCSGVPKVCQPLTVFLTGSTVPGSAGAVTIANGVAYWGNRDGVFGLDASGSAGCSGSGPVFCAPLWHALAGQSVTTPAVVGGRIHVAANGQLVTFKLP